MSRVFPRALVSFTLPLAGVATLSSQIVFAQSTTVTPAPANGGATTTTQTQVTMYPGSVAPPAPGQPIGGGNTGSYDKFEIQRPSEGTATAHGNAQGAVFLGGASERRVEIGGSPAMHVVRKGDTLWAICDNYFQNPYQWPRIWSLNSQIQNPHWINPGDQIRLRENAPVGTNGDPKSSVVPGTNLIDRRRQVEKGTIFLQDQGFIGDSSDDNWGEINGSPVDKMFLSPGDDVYLKISGSHDPKVGQELTIFRPVKSVPGGKVIQLQGTVRVDTFDEKNKMAKATLIEAMDVVERGASIGPIPRKLNIVPPVPNQTDIRARILASVHPHELYGQNQVVFIDKGEKEGLKIGNRLSIIRKGDAWHQSLVTDGDANRIALESDSPADVERVPRPKDPTHLPEQIVGELRIVAIKDHSATCAVTASTLEIELQDVVVARQGY